jgi:hypothetical protein
MRRCWTGSPSAALAGTWKSVRPPRPLRKATPRVPESGCHLSSLPGALAKLKDVPFDRLEPTYQTNARLVFVAYCGQNVRGTFCPNRRSARAADARKAGRESTPPLKLDRSRLSAPLRAAVVHSAESLARLGGATLGAGSARAGRLADRCVYQTTPACVESCAALGAGRALGAGLPTPPRRATEGLQAPNLALQL